MLFWILNSLSNFNYLVCEFGYLWNFCCGEDCKRVIRIKVRFLEMLGSGYVISLVFVVI